MAELHEVGAHSAELATELSQMDVVLARRFDYQGGNLMLEGPLLLEGPPSCS